MALFSVEPQKKIKNYLQIGNKLYVNYNYKNENSMGYFKVEIQEALSPLYFDNHQKLTCIASAMNMVKLLTAESQKNVKIFSLLEEFYSLLNSKDWIKNYIFWELELFKSLGYDLNFENLVNEKIIGNQKQYISKSSTEKRIIPNFLIEKNNSTEDIGSLLTGLKLLGDYLEKSILKPNNLNQPASRLQFINTLK